MPQNRVSDTIAHVTPNTINSVVQYIVYLVSYSILCHCGEFSNDTY